MTEIVITDSHIHSSLKCTGHTESRVCAGISALIQALHGWCINNEEHLTYYKAKVDSGCSEISLSGDPEALAVFNCVRIGLLQIEKGYPDAVKIEEISGD